MLKSVLENEDQVRNALDKDKSWYLYLGGEDCGKDYGYIKTNKELNMFLASFSAENNISKVKAFLSRNIMADSDYEQLFNVDVSIK